MNKTLTKACDRMGKAMLAAIVTLLVGYLGAVAGHKFLGGSVELGGIVAVGVMGALIIFFHDKKQ